MSAATNVSAHPALIVQPAHDATMANEQTAVGLVKQSCKPIALHFADVVSGVCISPSPRRLNHAIENRGSTQRPAAASPLVDVHSLHRRRKLAARRHPIPELVQ